MPSCLRSFPCRRPSPCRCLYLHPRHDTHAHAHAHQHTHASPFSSRSPLRPITVIPRVPACRHRDNIDHPSPLAPLVSPPLQRLHALLHLHTSPIPILSQQTLIYDSTPLKNLRRRHRRADAWIRSPAPSAPLAAAEKRRSMRLRRH